jgi:hypothetical protein
VVEERDAVNPEGVHNETSRSEENLAPTNAGSQGQAEENSPVESRANGPSNHKPHLEILAKSSGNKRSSSTDRRHLSHVSTAAASSLTPDNNTAENASSTTSLLRQDSEGPRVKTSNDAVPKSKPKGILAKVVNARSGSAGNDASAVNGNGTVPVTTKNHIRFDVAQDGTKAALLMRARMGHSQLRESLGSVLKRSLTDGAIVKMEKMLVRVDATNNSKLPDEYDENSSQGVVSTTRNKWREYMIVIRQNKTKEGADFVLQAYKSRVSEPFRGNSFSQSDNSLTGHSRF